MAAACEDFPRGSGHQSSSPRPLRPSRRPRPAWAPGDGPPPVPLLRGRRCVARELLSWFVLARLPLSPVILRPAFFADRRTCALLSSPDRVGEYTGSSLCSG